VVKKEKRPETKPRPPSETNAEEPESPPETYPDQIPSTPPNGKPGPPVYEYDLDAPDIPANGSPDSGDRQESKSREATDAHRITKREVVERLFEKNEVIVRLNKQVNDLEKERKELHDKWLRAVAEFENYRKRTRKEWDLLKQQTRTEVVLEILNVIDNFERAFDAAGDRDDEFLQGIRLIYNNMLATLERMGVRKIEALNAPFDPTYHMAIAQKDTEDAKKNDVVEVAQNGYLLDDIVIRPSRVVVAK
jgi:molecular chaperone GrpE